jgi:hypothetical protein
MSLMILNPNAKKTYATKPQIKDNRSSNVHSLAVAKFSDINPKRNVITSDIPPTALTSVQFPPATRVSKLQTTSKLILKYIVKKFSSTALSKAVPLFSI